MPELEVVGEAYLDDFRLDQHLRLITLRTALRYCSTVSGFVGCIDDNGSGQAVQGEAFLDCSGRGCRPGAAAGFRMPPGFFDRVQKLKAVWSLLGFARHYRRRLLVPEDVEPPDVDEDDPVEVPPVLLPDAPLRISPPTSTE